MKNLLPEFQTKEAAFAYLRTNKSKLISQKKALPTTSDNLEFGYSKSTGVKPLAKPKAAAPVPSEDEEDDVLQVDIIANMSGWCDSQMDVMIKDNWNKSIKDIGASGQKIIYHLKNHGYTVDDIIGKDPSLYTKDIDLSMFNIITDIKKAQGLLMTSLVMESYDEKVYNLYNDGQVKQHSIGLQYIQLLLCLDSTEDEDVAEKKNWDKYYPQVINKEKVDNYGYFWAVIEAKILEVSAVLYGSNILTPVIGISQPSGDTDEQPPKSTVVADQKQDTKSVIGCPACDYLFVRPEGGKINCPNCGQYVSPNSTTIMLSEEPFDWKKAIQETQFI